MIVPASNIKTTVLRFVVAALCLAAVLLASTAISAADEKSEEEQIDRLALAALMIRDGHFERAEALLTEIDPDDEAIDKGRLYTLSGLLLLRRGLFVEAGEKLREAVKAGQEDPLLHVYIAQAHYGLNEYDESLKALDQAGETADSMAELFQLRAQCYWKTDRPELAWKALEQGRAKFPDDPLFQRQKIFYLIEMGLYQQAVETGEGYLERNDTQPEDFVAIGEALRKTGQYEKALLVLERARLAFPDNMMVTAELAHAYLDKGHTYSAAALFEQAALTDPGSALEAAELFRRKGLHSRALYNNVRIPDQKEKVKQRLGILLEIGRYESAVALEPRLSRLGLLQDDEIRYALAYSYFKLRKYKQAEHHLKPITRSDLFNAATELRKAMETCANMGWECY